MKHQSNPAQPMLRTILIDDEPDARTALQILLKPHPEIEIVGEAHNLNSGEEAIRNLKPDLVFLDVTLGSENGFELLERFSSPEFQVIFCTGSDQHAIRAIKKKRPRLLAETR